MKRLISLLSLVAVLLLSCTKGSEGAATTTDPTNTDTQTAYSVETAQMLTNIFSEELLTPPTGVELHTGIAPCYSAESDTVSMLGMTDDGAVIVSYDMNGQLADTRSLVRGSDPIADTGVLTSEALYVMCVSYDTATGQTKNYIMRYSFEDDSRTYSDPFDTLFTSGNMFYNVSMAVDEEGYVYILFDSEVVVLDESLVYSFTVKPDIYSARLVSLGDSVIVTSSFSGSAAIDRATRSVTDLSDMPTDRDITQYVRGADGVLYYKTSGGFYSYDAGTEESVKVIDWLNSSLYPQNLTVTNVIDPEKVVMYASDKSSFAIYTHSPDIDLSNVTVLEVAYETKYTSVDEQIIRFNRENPDVRIVVRDYSVYDSTTKLTNDILTGLYVPDVIVGSTFYESIFTVLRENGLYTDLYTLMENDPDISADDLLDSVRRMCEARDGTLAMLTPSFTVMNTLIAPTSTVGEQTCWSITEMLDVIEGLPEGVSVMSGLTQSNAPYSLFGNIGYGMFVDTENGSCDFEGEDFMRYLRFLSTLPTETERLSFAELSERYHEGRFAVKSHISYGDCVATWMNMYAAFGTTDVVPIGYATTDPEVSNAVIGFEPYMVTSACEHPEEAWRFIKSAILSYGEGSKAETTVPVLRSQLERELSKSYGTYYEIYTDGTVRSFPTNVGYDPEGKLQKPGFRMLFDEAEAGHALEWYDKHIGIYTYSAFPLEITEIINEEITAYLGGVRSEAECGKIIQSRVSIRLAEVG